MVGEKGLEPSHLSILVPKTSASTNSAIRPQSCWVLYIIDIICPMTIIIKYINNHLNLLLNIKNDYFPLYKHM
jgi:hypothetical protein